MAVTVKQKLQVIPLKYSQVCECEIYQLPIQLIDPCPDPVCRYRGPIKTCLESNQNFLEFEVCKYKIFNNKVLIICKANIEQERRTIDAYRSRPYEY